MPLPYLHLVALSAFAILFYRVGTLERSWGLLWAALSVVASLIGLRLLPWGLLGALLAQLVLLAGITAYRMLRHE